jgi:magnesium chelatase family protein
MGAALTTAFRAWRTTADLAGSAHVAQDHIAEAVGLRARDRKLWGVLS